MEDAEQYCFEDFESESNITRRPVNKNSRNLQNNNNREAEMCDIEELRLEVPTVNTFQGQNQGKPTPSLRYNNVQSNSMDEDLDYELVIANANMAVKQIERNPKNNHQNYFINETPLLLKARGDAKPSASTSDVSIGKSSRYLKNTTLVKKQREWRKPKLFTKSILLHRTLSDGEGKEHKGTLSNQFIPTHGSMGNLESKSVEDRLQQLSQEEKFSVRVRPDLPQTYKGKPGNHGTRGIFRTSKFGAKNALLQKMKREHHSGEDKEFTPMKNRGLLQAFSEDNLDKQDPLLVNYLPFGSFMPLFEDAQKNSKVSSLPSEMDRITLFGPRDLIRETASKKVFDPEKLLLYNGRVSSISRAPSVESVSEHDEMNFRKRLPDTPDYMDTLLELPSLPRLDAISNPDISNIVKGHRAVTRSNTAPTPTLTEVDGNQIPPQLHLRSPMVSISSRGAAWRLEDDEIYQPSPSPSVDDTPFAQTSSQLYYAIPPQSATTLQGGGDKSPKNGSNGSLVKLARRFSQRGDRKEPKQVISVEQPHRQRSVSVDSGDVRKAHSLESLVQTGDKSKSSSSIPPSPNAPLRLQRSWSAKKRQGSNLDVETILERRPSDRDRSRRSSKHVTDFQAFFEAVEHQRLDVVQQLLESNSIDVNQPNTDEFTALDIAIMTNNMPMARLLLAHGARENSRFLMKDARVAKLNTLINEAEQIIQDLTSRIVNSGPNKDTATSKDLEKQLVDWEWRLQLLMRMKKGFENARIPDVPVNVRLSVTSSTSLHVTFEEPINVNGAAVTRYKIEWSKNEDFHFSAGEHIIYDVRNLSYTIQGLVKGTCYYVRVSAFNMKGFGSTQISRPESAIPSVWRDCEGCQPRFTNQLSQIDELFRKVRDSRPENGGEMRMSSPRASPSQVRKTVRKSLKNLFQSAPKFQRHLKRGIYLASILYHEDKILVTTEDHVPIVEVDENFPNSYHQDFVWFMKVSKTWEDVDLLRTDLSQSNSSSATVLFRNKLLQAVSHLQNVLGMQDLGQLYFEPIKDNQGTLIFALINHIKEPRMIPSAAVKWVPITRMLKRKSMSVETQVASDLLMTSLPEKLVHHRSSHAPLTSGLYLGYLKLRSSVDTIRVQVPEKNPNMLPYIKVRSNPNVSQQEWEWLHSLDTNEVKSKPSPAQLNFQQQLANSTKRLLKKLNIQEKDALSLRICDLEVIELTEEISMILVVPPTGDVCLGPGTSDEWLIGTDYMSVPIQVFEIAHISTYHPNFARRYTRLSSILEMDNMLSQQTVREAFSDEELSDAKERQDQIANQQMTLETIWKSMRWLTDILQYARDKQVEGGVPLSVLYAPPPSPLSSEDVINTISSQLEEVSSQETKNTVSTTTTWNNNNEEKLGQSKEAKWPSSTSANHKLVSGILRVFPAYHSGLAKGTSVKLHVTSKTTCREIINLVIQQLNKAIESRHLNAPIYNEAQWEEFCLVAAMGNMEHTLRDDFCPLQLQNPWTKGQLLVRPKDSAADMPNFGPSTCV